jgi:hypothetical protein
MKKSIVALFIVACCLSANSQFFSKEEKAAKEKVKPALKNTLPIDEQKTVYIELCAAKATAEAKAVQMHSIKIHHTPEQREALKEKAESTKVTLLKLYKEELSQKYQITGECLTAIETAGKENRWPENASKPAVE